MNPMYQPQQQKQEIPLPPEIQAMQKSHSELIKALLEHAKMKHEMELIKQGY